MSSELPVALTVAGSDSGGGAGVQADLAAMSARGVHAASALTAVTAQNTTGVAASEVLDPALVTSQIRTVFEDFAVGAVKTGMLGDESIVVAVADALASATRSGGGLPVVVDPVVVAESGDRLLSAAGVRRVRDDLLPAATLVTPNVPEAELLADADIDGPAAARLAGRRLCELGADAALVTGGHFDGDPVDVLVVGTETETEADEVAGAETVETFRSERVPAANTHGSGCTLSAAIAAELARGATLPTAVERAENHIERAVRRGRDVGAGNGPVEHLAPLKADAGVAAACDAVRETVRTFEREDVSRLVPEVGMNVAVAPDFAVTAHDVAAVAGRIHRVPGGVRATGGVSPGASSHVARFLLGVLATDANANAACNVRADTAVVETVRNRWDAVSVDRADEPEDTVERTPTSRTARPRDADGTMDWVASEAMSDRASAPDAVLDAGAVGKEPMVRLVATDAEALAGKVLALNAAVETVR